MSDTEQNQRQQKNPLSIKQLIDRRNFDELAFKQLVMDAPDAVVPIGPQTTPDDVVLARIVRDKAIESGVGTPITDNFESGNYVVVVNLNRLEELPEELRDKEQREQFLRNANYDIYLNALTGVSQESGKEIRKSLFEIGDCYDTEQEEVVSGHHHPVTTDAYPGENRPYLIINST